MSTALLNSLKHNQKHTERQQDIHQPQISVL